MIPIEVYQGQPGTAETTMYTVPAGQRLLLTEILLCNTDTTTERTVTIHARRGGAAASGVTRIYSALPLAANRSLPLAHATIVASGGIISGFVSAAATITVTISGFLEAV